MGLRHCSCTLKELGSQGRTEKISIRILFFVSAAFSQSSNDPREDGIYFYSASAVGIMY
jgi:hypothetical protein